MAKVKMHTIYAGPNGHCPPDGEINLPDSEAEALVKGRFAEYVSRETPEESPEEQPAAESATLPLPENAANPPAYNGRKGGKKGGGRDETA